jgi:hypothetical protein
MVALDRAAAEPETDATARAAAATTARVAATRVFKTFSSS